MTTLPISYPGDPAATESVAKSFGVQTDEWQRLVQRLGRTPTYAELGVVSVMWSEHCSYKSSRIHLGRLPTTGPQVVQGPGENAGAVDIGDGFCAVFKMESHNHPSYIEPYQGAATGVGGILRDVFTMGARPIANLNSLRFGRPDHPKTEHLVRGVVAGISGYGNSIGVPTVGGEVQFDRTYDGNILVNAFTVGIAKSDELFFGRAEGVGNAIMYVGARTGRDGIHGATMASAEFGEDSTKKLPTVQVGDPFTEKLLLEACLEIFATGCLSGVQDMGAAGLTSSSVEMADRAGNGVELFLDAIPRRTRALTPYEMLLSESQERMLMVAKEGREQEVIDICDKWDIDVAIIGRVTDTKRFVCTATPGFDPYVNASAPRSPQVVVDLPIEMLGNEAPKYNRAQTPANAPALTHEFPPPADLTNALVQLLGSPNIGSRAWIYRQYDHVVRNGTVVRPGRADAAIVRAFCEDATGTKHKYLALSVDCNGRHVQLDPFQGAAMAVAECARNIACTGATPLGLTDCLNFGNPEVPENMWRFSRAIDGIAAACTALNTPVVSGNVSLYNDTDGRSILPTPTVGIVGQLDNPDHRVELGFVAEGDIIVHLGVASRGALGGSEWLTQQLDGHTAGECVGIDLAAETRLQKLLIAAAKRRLLESAHDLSDGGFAACLAESCLSNGIGATVELPKSASAPAHALLFSEEPTRVIVSCKPSQLDALRTLCAEHQTPFTRLGTVGGTHMTITANADVHAPIVQVRVDVLATAHASALDAIVPDR